jgi:tetratricopeptide (TPR) repeat protein
MGRPERAALVRSGSHALLFFIASGLLLSGCFGDQIKANQQQLDQQQTELDQLKQQLAAIQAQNQSPAYPTPANGCDDAVLHEASRKGGERFAASDFPHALAYYQDAVNACPHNGRAQLNLARAQEAIGERTPALEHYRLAAQASGADTDADTAAQARDALARLQK